MNNQKIDKVCAGLSYASVFVLALFTFTAFSLSALHHILLFIPGVYFLIQAKVKREFHLSQSAWSLLAIIGIAVLSVIFNEVPNPIKNIFKLKYFLFGILGIFAYSYWFKNKFDQKKVKLIINLFIITTTIASLSGLIALYTGFNPLRFKEACHVTRTCGMYGMYMTYAYGIQFVMIILTGMLLFRKKLLPYINSPLLYSALFINFISFYLSYARGALLGFLVALPFFFFKKNKAIFLAVLVCVLIGLGLSYAFVPKLRNLISDPSRIHSVKTRISLYETAIKVAKEMPILGIGYRNFEPNVIQLKKKWKIDHPNFAGSAHNNFLEHLASTGVFGFIAMILFHLFWLIETYRRDDPFGRILFPLCIALVVSGMFQYTLGDGENLFLIMLLYGLSQVKVTQIEGPGRT